MKNRMHIKFCGFTLENPFCLASGPVAHSYEMCARALDLGWSGLFYKTISLFPVPETSPRFSAIADKD
jgi:dihydropyrimidine dehydrogenase (NAD+) subunit PreA